MAGINAELKHCEHCKTKVMNFPVVDWGTRITPNVQSALLSDPTVNYIIVIYDSMSQFVVPAVIGANATQRVKIDAFNGTPFVLGLIQEGKVQMDIGENLVDQAAILAEVHSRRRGVRLLGGQPARGRGHHPRHAQDEGAPRGAAHRPAAVAHPLHGLGDAFADL